MVFTLLAGALLGALIWTVLEYVIHGPLSHRWKTPITAIHNTHHRDPRLVLTGPVWIPVAFLLGLALVSLLGPAMGLVTTLTAALGFIRYEYIHWRIHYTRPRNAREQRIWQHHLAHHFRDPRRAHGVSTRLWDRVLGTMPDPDDCARMADRVPLNTRYGFWESFLAVHGIRRRAR